MNTLSETEWYKAQWHKELCDNGRVIHCRNVDTHDATLQREQQFDYALKRRAFERIMEYLPAQGQPILLTVAGQAGNCVQAAVKRNPAVRIQNVELRPEILRLWKAQKVLLGVTTLDYPCSFYQFVDTRDFQIQEFALVNAFLGGYASRSMHDCLATINQLGNVKVLALTVQCLNKIRNSGPFQDALREKYAGSNDQHAQCIDDWLSKYEMVDRFTYKKNEHSLRMEVFIFIRVLQ